MNYTDIVEWYNKYNNQIHKIMKYDSNRIKQKYSSKKWFPVLKIIMSIKSLQRAYRNPSILSEYLRKVCPLIKRKINASRKPFKYIRSPLDPITPKFLESLKTSHKIRCQQMKQGEIMQILIGNFPGWTDLGIGHKTGLDCRKKDNSCIMELKYSAGCVGRRRMNEEEARKDALDAESRLEWYEMAAEGRDYCGKKWPKYRYNTVNYASQDSLCRKLAEYKTHNPETRCIWGIATPKNEKNLKTVIKYNGYEIEKLQGNELFKLVFIKDNIYYGDKILAFTRFLLNI